MSRYSLKLLTVLLAVLSFPLVGFFGWFSDTDEEKTPAPNKANVIEVPSTNKNIIAEALTSTGINSGAVFNHDDSKIFFISEARPSHTHPQAYSLDLKSKVEQRLTHQDGEVLGPLSLNKGKGIIYASTTDEIKENPEIIRTYYEKDSLQLEKDSPWRLAPFELYAADSDGFEIRRLTEHEGFDAEAILSANEDYLYYASLVKGALQLMRMQIRKGRFEEPKLVARKSKFHLTQPAPSPDGKQLAWVELPLAGSTGQIYIGDLNFQHVTAITQAPAVHWAPSWHPTLPILAFASNRFAGASFEILTIELPSKCIKRWTYNAANDTLPTFSHDGKYILFTSDRSGTKQIYRMPFDNNLPCLNVLP